MLHKIILSSLVLFVLYGCTDTKKTDESQNITPSDSLIFEYTVEYSEEWTNLFYRKSGWFGGDGIFSFTLNGVDSTASGETQKTLLTFSDTYIGEVVDNKPLPGNVMVNNTIAYMEGTQPLEENISFHYKKDSNGSPATFFVPDNEYSKPGQYYWLGDGFINREDDGKLYLIAYHVEKTGPNVFDFALSNVSILIIPDPSKPDFENYTQITSPLHISNDRYGEADLGGGFFVNTKWAGAPDPDGFVYVYGCLGEKKELVVARVQPGSFKDFDSWTYWNGSSWSQDINDLSPLADNVSNELSVTPMKNGKYILVYQVMGLSEKVAVRIGDSPYGPFGPPIEIWTTPEYNEPPGILPYNAKAHPSLSKNGELLISYNTITFDFWNDIQQNAHIYRPRFIVLKSNALR